MNKYRERIFLFSAILCLIVSSQILLGAAAGEDLKIKKHQGDLKLSNQKGGFKIGEVTGKCELSANSGSIKIEKIGLDGIISTSGGDVEIGEVAGDIKTITGTGNIIIKKAQHVDAENTLGDIIIHSAKSAKVVNNEGGDVRIYNISGYSDIVAFGNIVVVLNPNYSDSELCSLKTIEGDVILYLPEDINADIEIVTPLQGKRTKETRIESAFALNSFDQKYAEGNTLSIFTSINKGGFKIRIYISKGDVFLKVQQ